MLKDKLESNGFNIVKIDAGSITVDDSGFDKTLFEKILIQYGFEIIADKEQILVTQIKQAVIELIHYMNNMNSVVRKSEYLVEKLNKSYSQLSRIFSKHEHITLEKYIILQKIERIKNLILQDEYSLSEISYMMDYSSVQHLSNQFKKITGYSVTEFKNNPKSKISFIDKL